MSREPVFAALIADVRDLAANPTHYGQETHGEVHAQVAVALERAQAVCNAASDLVAELDEDVKTWGADHLPDTTETSRAALAVALERAENSQSQTEDA